MNPKRLGIVADHGGFALKERLLSHLDAAGHETIDFRLRCSLPRPRGRLPRVRDPARPRRGGGQNPKGHCNLRQRFGAAVCANKVPGVRAALIHDHFSAQQGVEDDHMNVLCLGGRTEGPAIAWNLVQTFLAAEFSQAARHVRRLRPWPLSKLRGARDD